MRRILWNSRLLLQVKGPIAAARYTWRNLSAGERCDLAASVAAVLLCVALIAAVEEPPHPVPSALCSTDTECEEMYGYGMDDADRDPFYDDGGDWQPCRPSNFIYVEA